MAKEEYIYSIYQLVGTPLSSYLILYLFGSDFNADARLLTVTLTDAVVVVLKLF